MVQRGTWITSRIRGSAAIKFLSWLLRLYKTIWQGGQVDVQGGPAQDMDQLKEAVSSAAAGTGEVQRVIRESAFQPRAAAFTSLIQQCARVRAWQKAVDVFQALQETPGLKVCHLLMQRLHQVVLDSSSRQIFLAHPGSVPGCIGCHGLVPSALQLRIRQH